MTKKIKILSILSFWSILAVLAIAVDLDLSILIVNPSSFIGNVTADYGEIPGFALLLISLFILTKSAKKGSLEWLGYGALSLIPLSTIAYTVGWDLASQLVLLVALLIPFYLFITDKTEVSPLTVDASKKTLSFVVIVPLVLILGIKTIWGRTRFRDLSGDYSDFTPWFLPQGITGNRSFPSGHAGMAWVTVCLIFFIKDPTKRMVAMVVTILWAITVSYGRIVIGAHYFSDVLFSAGLSTVAILYLSREPLAIDL